MIALSEISDEQLLIRRPHFQLCGNELFWVGSKQPRRRLSDAQSVLWNLLRQPVPLRTVREAYGADADALIGEFVDQEFCDFLEHDFPGVRRRVLVIEPHADDAALSVGGTMWLKRFECEFLIATMASRSNHSRYRDLDCDIFDVDEVSKIRRLESELFARLVGGTHITVGLTDSDLRYRDENWTSDFFRQHRMSIRISASRIADGRERSRWTAAVRQLLASNPSAEVWLPLGGPHTDHLLTVDACFAAFAEDPSQVSGRVLRVYGESPYMARYPRQMQHSLDTLRNAGVVLESAPAPIDGAVQQKRRLASVYDSQYIEGMRVDTEASAHLHANAGGPAEPLWTIRELPKKVRWSGILSAATIEPALVSTAIAWAARNKGTANLRVLLLMPTGQWAGDLRLLMAAYPLAQFEVVVSDTAAAEVTHVRSDRVDIRIIANGTLPWVLYCLGIAFSMKARPTLFHAGERRLWQARLLSRFWLGSDTLVIGSMNEMLSALQVNC